MTKKQTQKKSAQKKQNIFKRMGLGMYNYFFSRKFLIFLRVLIAALLAFYIFLFVQAKNIETKITFPGTDINLKELTNHPAGLIVAEDVKFTASNAETITGLFIDNGSEKVVYYFHGNGAPLPYFYSDIQYISDLGYSVIALEYPGYGDSTGTPHLENNSLFAQEFYEHMKQKLDFEEKDMIVWGYSVGTAVSVEFAKDKDFDSLVLFSALASRYDMGAKLL